MADGPTAGLDLSLIIYNLSFSSHVRPPRDESALERHLVRHPRQAVAGRRLRQPADLEEHLPGLHDRRPVLRLALALAHPRLGRDGGDALVREDPDVVPPLAGD